MKIENKWEHGHIKVLNWLRSFMRKINKFQFRSLEFKKEMIGRGWRLVIYMDEK